MSEVYVLLERSRKMPEVKRRAANVLAGYASNGYRVYGTAEAAEAGRMAGEAYDEPWKTRVVGFRVEAFLPKKKK